MDKAKVIENQLYELATEEKRLHLPRFFKTGKGQYGEGDIFIGVVVPNTRKVARDNKDATKEDIIKLLSSKYHEVRLCALLIMVEKCKKGNEEERKRMYDIYMAHTGRINNWDLVDLSAPEIVGKYLANKPRNELYKMARSPLLWENRIAIVATLALIRQGETDDTYALATILMTHTHDLIHKASGWMLREAGKRDPKRLYDYVEKYRTAMPRTMLRYAIEKFTAEDRKKLMRRQD